MIQFTQRNVDCLQTVLSIEIEGVTENAETVPGSLGYFPV